MAGRTPEQIKTDEELNLAIERSLVAYGYAEPGAITAGFVIAVDQRIWRGGAGDGEAGMTGICMLYKDGDMPWPNIVGILRLASLRVEQQATQEWEGDSD